MKFKFKIHAVEMKNRLIITDLAAMVSKLGQIPPDIWMTLPLEAKK
jgi:hypothetical protein